VLKVAIRVEIRQGAPRGTEVATIAFNAIEPYLGGADIIPAERLAENHNACLGTAVRVEHSVGEADNSQDLELLNELPADLAEHLF